MPTITSFIKHHYRHFNAAVVVDASEAYVNHLKKGGKMFLSMAGAIQAPFILMSQNRQSENDRIRAARDYEINQKAELEIMMLNEKVDRLLEWAKAEAKSQKPEAKS